MGPEQTLRRETWTDRREISVRVSFIFKKIQNMTFFEPGDEKTTKNNAPARNAPQQTPNLGEKQYPYPYPIIPSNNPITQSYLIPILLISYSINECPINTI